jgi:hypothetical protein
MTHIYRYNFDNEFVKELYIFAKIHQYDNRIDFKEGWNIWVEDNNDIIELEVRRLKCLEYNGDILDKMFKSARYYFRKKKTSIKEPVVRRDYKGISKLLLNTMIEHIIKNIVNEKYKPSVGFVDFCKENTDLLFEEIKILNNDGVIDINDIKLKIKKTYKNRYFIIIKNIKIKNTEITNTEIKNTEIKNTEIRNVINKE